MRGSVHEEAYRVQAVADHDLAPDNLQDELAPVLAAAASRWGVPRATFTVVEGDRQFFPARLGMESAETSRAASLCAVAIARAELLLVLDTRHDLRLRRHPAVVGPPFIRFYAGVPLRLAAHAAPVGALCVLDTRPRAEVDAADLALLTDLSFVVLGKLAQRRARVVERRRRADLARAV